VLVRVISWIVLFIGSKHATSALTVDYDIYSELCFDETEVATFIPEVLFGDFFTQHSLFG
jgi:hypothetical protein